MADFATITHDELQKKLETNDDFVLIDVLGPMSYQRAHLPGAAHIPADADNFVDQVKEVAAKETEIVVYCGSFECGLSPKAAAELTEAGFENVIDYEGGLKDWAENGHDLEGEEAEAVREKLAQS